MSEPECNKYKVGTLKSLIYVPNYITKQEQAFLMDKIYSDSTAWHQLKKRRLQNWGGNPKAGGMVQEPLPEWLTLVSKRLFSSSFFPSPPNHGLINEYDGNEGIMPHKDGPIYYPKVAIITLNGSAMLSFRKTLQDEIESEVLLEPCSLIIFQEEAYENYFHGIADTFVDTISEKTVNVPHLEKGLQVQRTLRISITMRVVPTIQEENAN
uniref:Fe2OG dioxygenase domain-containing protein n=1 Tax=Arcella intermedia TaxID=1963864 RepID=A0A6B2LFU1_9EUKA